jgi:hypothetical protein
MKQIGDAMPLSIRETSGGGLARTPTGAAYQEKLERLEQ